MDENGILVKKIFFFGCGLISFFCFLAYKFVANNMWMFIRKYQIKNLDAEPPQFYRTLFRVWTLVLFFIFLVQAIMAGK